LIKEKAETEDLFLRIHGRTRTEVLSLKDKYKAEKKEMAVNNPEE
jgi:hypothetical protein